MKKVLIYSILLFTYLTNAQGIKKYSNEFMSIGVDARSMGMSNAVTAHTNDVTSGYWNPAGLIALEDSQLSLMHASYFANIAQYDYAAFAMPIDDESAFGMSIIRFGVDDIMNTTQLIDAQGNIDYNRISLFSAADYGVTFSYAHNAKLDGFTYGANAKVIRRIIGDFATSWGFGFDLGAQFKTQNDWQFGIMVRDITTTYNVWAIDEKEYNKIKDAIPGENQEMPDDTEITAPKAHIGIAKKFIHRYDYSFLVSANLNMQFAETNDIISTSFVSIDPAIGLEVGYNDLVFFRGGVGNFQNITTIDNTDKLSFQPNFGVGFKYRGIALDYALTDIGNQSAALYSNIFSVRVDLGIFRR